MSADGGIHATRDHSNITSLLRNTKKSARVHSEQKSWKANIQCSAHPWQHVSAYSYSCLHSSTATAFQLGAVWTPSSQPWYCSKRLAHVYYLQNWLCCSHSISCKTIIGNYSADIWILNRRWAEQLTVNWTTAVCSKPKIKFEFLLITLYLISQYNWWGIVRISLEK
jgi:hypothetical protein